MPHVIVKLWPGKSDDQKRRLTESIVRGVTDSLDYGEDAVSVAFEEVAPPSGRPGSTSPTSWASGPT